MNTDLEESMRPGRSSSAGFLGRDEKLDDVLKADDETVKKLGLTHEQIADRLEYFIKAVGYSSGAVVDNNYRVRSISWRGFQTCPWDDNPQYGSMDFIIENLRTGESLRFPGLIVHLIREHHFYEGNSTDYRVDPEKAAKVLDIRKE